MEYKPLIPPNSAKEFGHAQKKRRTKHDVQFLPYLASYVKNPTSYVTDEDTLALVYGDVR